MGCVPVPKATPVNKMSCAGRFHMRIESSIEDREYHNLDSSISAEMSTDEAVFEKPGGMVEAADSVSRVPDVAAL